MNKRLVLVCLFAFGCFATPTVSAESPSYFGTKDLYDLCASDDEKVMGYCLLYIYGVADTLIALQGEGFQIPVCLTLEVDGVALIDAFTDYVDSYPESGKYVAASVVTAALYKKYRC